VLKNSQVRSPATGPVSVTVATTEQEWAALGTHWNALLEASRANSVFLTWEWVSTWWRVYGAGHQLYVMVARAGSGELVGVAPLQLVSRRVFGMSAWRTVTFIGSGGDVTPEYLDFVVRAGWEQTVVDAFLDRMLGDATVSEFDLQPFASHSPNLERTRARLQVCRGGTRRVAGPRCPYLVLPPTVDVFLATRSRNYRKKIGEYQRRCRRRQARVRRALTEPDVERDLRQLECLHTARWRGESRAFRSAQYVQFHQTFARLMLARDGLRIFSMESGDRVMAMSYCLFHAGRYYFYQAGRDPSFAAERPGLVLMHQVIEAAIHEHASVFDFLSGDEAYKYRWATADARSDRVQGWKWLPTRVASTGRRIALLALSPVAGANQSPFKRIRRS
jgi:CelD/BcsL family acetyltransferase involved in cellulose biosynthesis